MRDPGYTSWQCILGKLSLKNMKVISVACVNLLALVLWKHSLIQHFGRTLSFFNKLGLRSTWPWPRGMCILFTWFTFRFGNPTSLSYLFYFSNWAFDSIIENNLILSNDINYFLLLFGTLMLSSKISCRQFWLFFINL